MKTVYLAGPMRGKPLSNFPMFARVARLLREDGYEVSNPAEFDLESGFAPGQDLSSEQMVELFRHDFLTILKVDAVIFLPDWRLSVGARSERLVAQLCGVRCLEITLEPDKNYTLTPVSDTVRTSIG